MKIDYSPRGSGKTTRLIQWLQEDYRRILITFSHQEEDRLKRDYPELASRIIEWRTYQQRYMHGSQIKEIAVDNADIILNDIFRQPVDRISISS